MAALRDKWGITFDGEGSDSIDLNEGHRARNLFEIRSRHDRSISNRGEIIAERRLKVIGEKRMKTELKCSNVLLNGAPFARSAHVAVVVLDNNEARVWVELPNNSSESPGIC
jgi:hypothetical protein